VVEGTGLENRHTGDPGIVSSNLTLSVVAVGHWPVAVGERPTANGPWPTAAVPDGWPSGLRCTPGKRVYGKPYRGFESLPIR
jgi:hypothetical protein